MTSRQQEGVRNTATKSSSRATPTTGNSRPLGTPPQPKRVSSIARNLARNRHMARPVVFVIGASGKIGSSTVSALSSKYRDVVEIRAGVRHPDNAYHLKSLAGVAVIKACMGSPDLVETFKRVDRLYIVTPATEDRAQLAISRLNQPRLLEFNT